MRANTFSLAAALAALASCGGDRGPAAAPPAPRAASGSPTASAPRLLATVEGTVDAAAGTMTMRVTDAATARPFLVQVPLDAAPRDRLAAPIDGTRRVALRGHLHPALRGARDLGRADAALPLRGLQLHLAQTPEQAAALDLLLAAQRDPASPSYHRWLTPEEYADRFGATQHDVDLVTAWLRSQGLTVHGAARGRDYVEFSGAAAQVERALGTRFHRYEVDGEVHYANATEPALPADLARLVRGFQGLHDFRLKPHVRVRALQTAPSYTGGGGTHDMSPNDFGTIYDVKSLWNAGLTGAGQTIAILGQTDVHRADVTSFRSTFKLPANPPDYRLVPTSADPGIRSADEGEALLDMEWSGAVAPDATIVYVYSTDVFASAWYAIDNVLAPVMSLSYGGCEGAMMPWGYVSGTAEPEYRKASALGITFLASSGDSGAAGCDPSSSTVATGGLAVNYPASSPEVTAVGGTMFDEGGSPGTYWGANGGPSGYDSALSYIPEVAWNEYSAVNTTSHSAGLWSTGGGVSTFFTSKPAWQAGPGVPADGARDVPDVSLTAAVHDGYYVYSEGDPNAPAPGLYIAAGTSASSPSFAGILALLNQYLVAQNYQAKPGLGNVNPMLYGMAAVPAVASVVFHDVTGGNNIEPCSGGTGCVGGFLGYDAGPGYDVVTGVGSVVASELVWQWAANEALGAQNVVQNGTPDANPPNSLELVTVGTPGETTCDGSVQAWGGDVRLRNFYAGTQLQNVYVELQTMSPAGHEACEDQNAPNGAVSSQYGLFSYGTLGPAGSAGDRAVATWKFVLGGGERFTFTGRVMATDVAAP